MKITKTEFASDLLWWGVIYWLDNCLQVSIFLRDKVQYNNTGRFVLPVSGALPVDVELPGKIRLVDSSPKCFKIN